MTNIDDIQKIISDDIWGNSSIVDCDCPECKSFSNNGKKQKNNKQNKKNKHNKNNHIDPKIVVDSFMKEYYGGVTNSGWHCVQYMFDQNCMSVIRNNNVGNEYDLLNVITSKFIKRGNFNKIRNKWLMINPSTIVLDVLGELQFVAFNGTVSKIIQFSDTFVLHKNGKTGFIKCTHHIFNF